MLKIHCHFAISLKACLVALKARYDPACGLRDNHVSDRKYYANTFAQLPSISWRTKVFSSLSFFRAGTRTGLF